MCFNKTLLKKQQQGAVRNGLQTIVCQPLVRREDSRLQDSKVMATMQVCTALSEY